MKREIEQGDATAAAEGSRPKRRREEEANASSDVDMPMTGIAPNGNGEGALAETVKDQGLRLWQIVKDAVNKEGRTLSTEFLKKPSKRLYPDYYQIIQQPIALEDIKKQLDNDAYPTLEAVRVDFELCFTNAKTYNMKESDIWKDAKDLLKLVNKAYQKMVPSAGDGENADGSGDKGKSKAPNLYRLIKSRLQKLIEKTDDSGRILSTEFMELPSKKEWPIYYKEIKRPQCLENIFASKRIKRKEYPTTGEFAADVELVFNNAMTFNQEHTQIWEDALILRDYFRQLMSDLPLQFALPEYSKLAPKIKIKPQVAQPSTTMTPTPAETQIPASPNITLRVPPLGTSNASKPQPQPVSTPSVTPSPSLTNVTTLAPQAIATSQKQAKLPVPTSQPATQSVPAAPQASTSYAHYPNALYHASTAAASTSGQKTASVTQSQSPTPSAAPGHQLKYVSLRVQPNNRKIYLDHRDGVKSWSMRLLPSETGVLVGDVSFLYEEEGESSGEEEIEREPKQEEEEEEEEEEGPIKNGRKRGKGKGKGRPPRTAAAKPTAAKLKPAPKKVTKPETQIKLDGIAIKLEDKEDKWTIDLTVGSHVLEIGEAGGVSWKVYAERLSTV